ncbi:MAG: hypothetical protein ACLP1W_10220 [Rhodomicrobium sp.]
MTETMTKIADTGFARLEAEGRLVNPVLKAPGKKAGRFGFRGELALKFAPKVADEARPPELKADQVMAIAEEGNPTIPYLSCYLHSFEYLKPLAEVLAETLSPTGKYFCYCDNMPLLKRYQVEMSGVSFYILPIDEANVYNEQLELLYLEKSELKKLDTYGKLDKVADAAQKFSDKFSPLTYEEGLKLMGPLRNRNANRPV